MMKKIVLCFMFFLLFYSLISAQPWQQDDGMFNSSGVPSVSFSQPRFADLDGDGDQDMILGSIDDGLIYIENIYSSFAPGFEIFTSVSSLDAEMGVCADLDNDDDLDLITGGYTGLNFFENIGTWLMPVFQKVNDFFTGLSVGQNPVPYLADVDDNGYADAIVGDLSGSLFFHRNTGFGFVYESGVLASVALGGWSVPRLVDMDDDNDFDIVAGNENGNLFYFQNQGTPTVPDWVEIPGYFGSIDVGSDCSPTIGDLTLNGNLDVVTGDIGGELQFFENIEGNWTENPYPVSGISGGQNTAPALVDLDGDGDLDLTLGNYGGTFNYFENQHIIVDIDPEEPQTENILLRNFPNPFNEMTTISYFTTELTENAEIYIYNIKGQLVRSLSIYSFPNPSMGMQKVSWNGKDDMGKEVKPGIYLYKIMNIHKEEVTGKCLKIQ